VNSTPDFKSATAWLTPLQISFLQRFFASSIGAAFFLTGCTALAAFYLSAYKIQMQSPKGIALGVWVWYTGGRIGGHGQNQKIGKGKPRSDAAKIMLQILPVDSIRGAIMKQLTVRKVDEVLHSSLKRAAQQHGVSVNRYILHVLKQAVGLSKDQQQPDIWHDLDHLAGTWTLEQARELGLCLNEQRDIDERLWS
jgi:hypothetical protein